MTAIADINVLLPILVEGHTFHPAAWRWWQGRADASVGLCLPTQLGVLRMLTNAKVMGGDPVTPSQALAAWNALAADPRCVWLDTEPGQDAFLSRFVANRRPSPNLWTDAWLSALAAIKGVGLTSFDADFRSFNLPDFEHLKP